MICHEAVSVPGSLWQQQLAGRWLLLWFASLAQTSNESLCRVRFKSTRIWAHMDWLKEVLGSCDHPWWQWGLQVALLPQVCAAESLLRLPLASLSRKTPVHFVGLWVRPCVWQAALNPAVTAGQPICSSQSSHYPCLWTVSKCRRLLAASPCPRCLHNQMFPQQKRGLVTGGSRCVICRKGHDWTVVFSA